AYVARLPDHRLAALCKYCGNERDMRRIVHLRELPHQLQRRLVDGVHEPTTASGRREIVEELDQKLPILRQDRPDDDALTAGQVRHVDQLCRITMASVDHCMRLDAVSPAAGAPADLAIAVLLRPE